MIVTFIEGRRNLHGHETFGDESPQGRFSDRAGERDIQRAGDRDYYTFAIDPTFRHSLINQGLTWIVLP